MPAARTLDANLARLLREAYRPVAARPGFRVELEARLAEEIAAGASSSPAPHPAAVQRAWGLPQLAAAAALLIVPFVAYLITQFPELLGRPDLFTDPDAIVAGGQVAVSVDDAGWAAMSESDRVCGVALADHDPLELRTPRAAEVLVDTGDAELQLFAASSLRLTQDAADGLVAQLANGGLQLDADEPVTHPLLVATPEGTLNVEHGSLRVTLDADGAHILVDAGRSFGPDGRQLPIATPIVLRGGALSIVGASALSGPDSDVNGNERTVVAEQTEVEPESEKPAQEPAPAADRAVLSGTVTAPEFSESAARFRVVLLRQVSLPDVSDPKVFSFADPSTDQDPGAAENEGGRALATSAGRFRIDDIRPGTYTVFVRADGFATWKQRDVELDANGETTLAVDLTLGTTIAGRVVDHNGAPIEGAFVLSEHAAPTQILPLNLREEVEFLGAVRSDHEGRFELPHIAPGKHILRASAAGHDATWTKLLNVESGVRIDDVALELGPESVIYGRVAYDDGTPWADAYVVCSLLDYTFLRPCMTGEGAETQPDGSFELRGLPAGSYVVLNSKQYEGGAPVIRSALLKEGDRKRIDLPSFGTYITGRVHVDEAPLARHHLTFVPNNDPSEFFTATTRADGSFDVPGLSPRTYALYLSREMATDMLLLDTIEVPDVPELTLDLSPPTAKVTGRVLADGQPLGRVLVVVERIDAAAPTGFAGRAMTDEDGRYELFWLAAGEYDISVFATTGRYGEERVEGLVVLDGQTIEAPALELTPGGSLRVQVKDDAGTPLKGVRLRFLDSDGRSVNFDYEGGTDAFGRFSVLGLRTGRWTVTAELGAASVETFVDVREGQHAETTLTIPR